MKNQHEKEYKRDHIDYRLHYKDVWSVKWTYESIRSLYESVSSLRMEKEPPFS